METIYKGYTIRESQDPWARKYLGEIEFFINEHLHGANTIEEAKDAIDEITGDYELPSVTFIGERIHNGKLIRIYRADSGSDQYRFANLFNGRPVDETHLILMVERVEPTEVFNMVAQAIAEPIRQAN